MRVNVWKQSAVSQVVAASLAQPALSLWKGPLVRGSSFRMRPETLAINKTTEDTLFQICVPSFKE